MLSDRYAFATLETDGKTNWTIVYYGKAIMRQDNLVDIPSPGSARSNLGLGSLATHPSTDFLATSNNLSDLTDQAAARANLGLAASSAITFSSFDPGAIATPADVTGNFYTGKLLSTDVYWASRIPATLPFTVTSGTTVAGWDFGTFINAIGNIPSTAPSSITLSPAINVKPGQRGFIIIKCATSTARTLTWPPMFNLVPSTAQSTLIAGAVSGVPSANLFEYWAQTYALVRIRVATSI
jgi:hypothetical protein